MHGCQLLLDFNALRNDAMPPDFSIDESIDKLRMEYEIRRILNPTNPYGIGSSPL